MSTFLTTTWQLHPVCVFMRRPRTDLFKSIHLSSGISATENWIWNVVHIKKYFELCASKPAGDFHSRKIVFPLWHVRCRILYGELTAEIPRLCTSGVVVSKKSTSGHCPASAKTKTDGPRTITRAEGSR